MGRRGDSAWSDSAPKGADAAVSLQFGLLKLKQNQTKRLQKTFSRKGKASPQGGRRHLLTSEMMRV